MLNCKAEVGSWLQPQPQTDPTFSSKLPTPLPEYFLESHNDIHAIKMAEAIAAIGVAANIIQFIDVGSRVVSKASRIYQLEEAVPAELSEAQKDCEGLRRIVKDVQSSESSATLANHDKLNFQMLGADCAALANEISHLVAETRLPDNGGKRAALKTAVKTMRQKEQIQLVQSRLDKFRQDMMLHLLDLIRHQAQQSISQQEKVLDEIKTVHRMNEGRFGRGGLESGMGNIFVDALEALSSRVRGKDDRHMLEELITTIYHSHAETNLTRPAITSERKKYLEAAFLKALEYPRLRDREGRIPEAHEKTFRWIFEDETRQERQWCGFKQWLKSDSQLYWITGKAGSGKSILMKYICLAESNDSNSKSRCAEILEEWAGSSRIVIASFYFWNSGTPEQMSRRGLLLSLLSQILHQMPELISAVSPNQWEALCLFDSFKREFNDQELEAMLRSVAKMTGEELKLCLFVDGIDEFEGQHIDLVNLFNDLIKNQQVKICVSSRPWIVFEDAFKHKPSLMLQDLTFSDIEIYVTDTMSSDIGFEILQKIEPEYAQSLIENIVSKASGVFLWVKIVVNSLLAGMRDGDRISDLQKQLDLLPLELEKLYDKIFSSLNPSNLEHAAQLFKLVEGARDPPSLLLLSFADEESPDFALECPLSPIDLDEANNRAEIMRRRLKSRCNGFLEVEISSLKWTDTSSAEVHYLHRTVRDYIMSPEAKRTLEPAISSSFDPYLRLLRGSLACTKRGVYDTGPYDGALKKMAFFLSKNIDACFFYAAHIRKEHSHNLVILLDDLEKTGKMSMSQTQPTSDQNREDIEIFAKLVSNGWVATISYTTKIFEASTFLSLSIEYGIVDYLSAKVNGRCIEPYCDGWNTEKALLEDAIFLELKLDDWSHRRRVKADLIACLLEKGADPNVRDKSVYEPKSTIWTDTLIKVLHEHNVNKLEAPWPEILELMIKHGASLNKKTLDLVRAHDYGTRSSQDVTFDVFFEELRIIKRRVGHRQASPSLFGRWRQKRRSWHVLG